MTFLLNRNFNTKPIFCKNTQIRCKLKYPAVYARFLPLKENPAHFTEVGQHLINFLALGSGGPEEYKGKDKLSSHKGMNISLGEYKDVVDAIMQALDENKIDVECMHSFHLPCCNYIA